MSRPWSIVTSLLRAIGKIRLPLPTWGKNDVRVGAPDALDALGSTRWRDFTTAERLCDVWAPLPGSVWEPFHCPTLFAALDRIPSHSLGPAPEAGIAPWLRGELPSPNWLNRETWLILDAPAITSIAVAAQVASLRLAQPVCTFDNWPNPLGLVRPEKALAGLLYFAPWLDHARKGLTVDLPPMWICDSERLGSGPGRPGQFDNRYFLDDSILPGPAMLKEAGIRKVVYGTIGPPSDRQPNAGTTEGTNPERGFRPAVITADLPDYLASLETAGLQIEGLNLTSLDDWRRGPVRFERPIAPVKNLSRHGFFRSTAGGFGAPIPEPSSSSG